MDDNQEEKSIRTLVTEQVDRESSGCLVVIVGSG